MPDRHPLCLGAAIPWLGCTNTMTAGWRRSGSEFTDDRLQPEAPHYILSFAVREVIVITTGDRAYKVAVICDDSARD